MSYQIVDVRIILPINEEGMKEIKNRYFVRMFRTIPAAQVNIKKQPNIVCLLMEVFDAT